MKEHILFLHRFNLNYARLLIKDIPDDRMAAQPVAGRVMNHAAWVIGHLACSNNYVVQLLGNPEVPTPSGWDELFGIKSSPLADGSRYPKKDVLIKAYEEANARAAEAYSKASAAKFDEPMPEPMRARFPKVGNFATLLVTSHDSIHLGQLSAWRRALGYPSVM